MTDRYRYPPRARSPPIYNPARTSLPTNISVYTPPQEQHLHAVPTSRREIVAAPRSSTSSASSAGTILTTYKVKAEPVARGSSVREGSRTRRSTLDNNTRPTIPMIVTAEPRQHRPIIHGAGIRPPSPLKNPYQSSEEDYGPVTVASSRHGRHHAKRHSTTMDDSDMNRLAQEQERSRLRIAPPRESHYTTTRSRQPRSSSIVRRADTVADDYGDDGYGYTNPKDLVQYDLDNNPPPQRRARKDSFDGGRQSRPMSISGYNDLVGRSYDPRERGPPPSTRGFDRLPGRTPTWDQPQVRMPVPPSPIAPVESVQRAATFEPVELLRRRSNSHSKRSSYYAEPRRDRERDSRDDYYEVRDEPRRDRGHRHERSDDLVETRGFGIRSEEPRRIEESRRVEEPRRIEESRRADEPRRDDLRWAEEPRRVEESRRTDDLRRAEEPRRSERSERVERPERSDRYDDDRSEHKDHKDHKDHKGRDALAAGLSLAGAALGINAVKNASRDDKDDREDRDDRRRRERDYDEEPRRHKDREDKDGVDLTGRDPKERRHKDREDKDGVDLTGRDPKERRHRDEAPSNARDIPNTTSRDVPPSLEKKSSKERSSLDAPIVDLAGRDPKERHNSKDDRDNEERHERHRHRSEAAKETAVDSRSASSSSDEAAPHRSERRAKREVVSGTPAFNPKDTMDLKALKEALNSKDTTLKPATKEPVSKARTESNIKSSREAAEIRNNLEIERRPRDPGVSAENRQPRVVSPPRSNSDDKPVKGILRQPREKFPEDPAPIREGVAPLKDAKKDGIPPDARWTKISRRLVNPAALEAGKERFEAREDFVIVLRVLSKEEVQGYAEVTEKIRANREEQEELEASEARRRARRERHERHKREKASGERSGRSERSERPERERRLHRRESNSESDTSDSDDYENDRVNDKPKMLEGPKKRTTFENAVMSGGLADVGVPVAISGGGTGNLREVEPGRGVYEGYVRNPPLLMK